MEENKINFLKQYGVDTEAGINNTMDFETYNEVLLDFLNTFPGDLNKANSYRTSGDINNYVIFKELYEEYESEFSLIVRESYKYGINLIVSLSLDNEMRYALAQNFAQSIALQFYDENNYYGIVGKTNVHPASIEGRGLVKLNQKVYEYQTASITENEKLVEFIKKKSDELRANNSYTVDSMIKTLPKKITSSLLVNYKEDDLIIPIGMEIEDIDLKYLDLENNYITVVTGESKDDYGFFKIALTKFLQREYNLDIDIIESADDIDAIRALYDEAVARNHAFKNAEREGKEYKVPPAKVVIISDLRNILEDLEKEIRDDFEGVLYKGSLDYNIHIILFEKNSKLNVLKDRVWFKNIKSDYLLWIGNGFDEQYLFKCNDNFNIKTKIPNKCGILIEGGDAKIVKLVEDDSDE